MTLLHVGIFLDTGADELPDFRRQHIESLLRDAVIGRLPHLGLAIQPISDKRTFDVLVKAIESVAAMKIREMGVAEFFSDERFGRDSVPDSIAKRIRTSLLPYCMRQDIDTIGELLTPDWRRKLIAVHGVGAKMIRTMATMFTNAGCPPPQ